MMNMTAVVLSSFLPMWQHRLEAVLALLRGEPGQQVAERFRMARSDLYKFRARALQAVRQALREQPRGPKRPHNRLSAEREQVVVKNLDQHPTWSARQLHEHLGDEAPHPRTIDRIRRRHGLTRQLKRPAPTRSVARFTPEVKTQARHLIVSKAERGPHRLAWDLRNAQGITMSPTTMKRLKRAVRLETDLSPVAPLAPTANWLFYERKHPHSLWHGDCLEKVILADTERQSSHLAFLDDYSRGYVFCDLFREVTTCITIEALIVAMRQWQVIPKQVLLDNAGPFRGQLLAAFCQNLGIELIHSSPRHPQTNGKLERAFRDDMPEFYRQYERWDFDVLRRDLPAYVEYRNTVRGHWALGGQPARSRLDEQHRMALPWVLDQLESYARYEWGHRRVTEAGCLRLLSRHLDLDTALAGQRVTCYETLEGFEVRSADQQVYLLRDYRKWLTDYRHQHGQAIPEDLRFEPHDPVECPRIAVAYRQ
jgi:transposase InsO family protein